MADKRGLLTIGIPYRETGNNGWERLCAEITINTSQSAGKESENEITTTHQTLYFEVESKWSKYFVTEISDPFVLAVIERAMKNSWDIECATPMSEDLYYSLSTYAIPVLARNLDILHEIEIRCDKIVDKIPSKGAVGTGFSAGVDSFYTVLKHLTPDTPHGKCVSHLLLAVNGATSTGLSTEVDEIWFDNTCKRVKPYADDFGMEFVAVKGNIDLFYVGDRCFNGDCLVTSCFVHVLRKLFSTYYWASTYPAEVFCFDNKGLDGGYWENVMVSYISVNDLRFYHSGSETTRIGKIKFIANNSIAQKGLLVCGHDDAKNCGVCVKCLRTMMELYSINKLEQFKKTFPVDSWKKHLVWRMGMELAIDHPPFTDDIIAEMRRNGRRIPIASYCLVPLLKLFTFVKKRLHTKKWALRLWYKYGLDEKIGGKKVDETVRAARLEGRHK
jgi:hypothetical protein